MDMFVDGSSFYEGETRYTGWAVVEGRRGEVLAEGSLRGGSAQIAELHALKAALNFTLKLTASENSSIYVNIFTDSAYSYHVVRSYGPVWKRRGYMTTAGTTISHQTIIKEILETCKNISPNSVAVCKVTGHSTFNDWWAKGNSLADKAVREAARGASLGEVTAIFPVHPNCAGSETLSKLYTNEDNEICQKG